MCLVGRMLGSSTRGNFPSQTLTTPKRREESFHHHEDDGGGVNDLGINGFDIGRRNLPLDLPPPIDVFALGGEVQRTA